MRKSAQCVRPLGWHRACVGLALVDAELTAQVEALARVYLIPTAWKLLGAVALWIIGSWIIKLVRAAFGRFLHLRHFDVTLASYVEASAGVLLQVLLFIAVLGVTMAIPMM